MAIELCLATSEETRRTLPGDALIPSPGKAVTHAVTINAPPEAVWPWLVQLGSGRAGWYSYDRIDNGGRPSARQIVPELQLVSVGDLMPAIPGTEDAFLVREVNPGKALVLVVPLQAAAAEPDRQTRMAGPLRVSWALVLEPLSRGNTRLISRGRISRDWLTPQAGGTAPSRGPIFIERVYGLLAMMPWAVMLPFAMMGHYIMESRMLRGIKSRSEK